MRQPHPPKLARKIFEWYCGAAKVEDLLGDMDEWFYTNLENHSPSRAKIKYWKQVLSLLLSYAIRRRKRQAHLSPFSTNGFSAAIIKNFVTVAYRSLYRHKYFTAVNVLGLAIGMSLSLLIITMFIYVNTFDNFHENKSRIYRVITSFEKGEDQYDMASAPAAVAHKLKTDFTGIEKITRITSNFRGDVVVNNRDVPVQGYYTDPEFLSIFSFDLVEGNVHEALQRPNSIILTQSSAEKLFGSEPAFGKTIEIVDQGNFEVTGILRDLPKNTHLFFESLVSYSTLPQTDQSDVIAYDHAYSYGRDFVYLLLHSEDQVKNTESYLQTLAMEAGKNSEAKIGFQLQSLNDITPSRDLFMLTGGLGPAWEYSGFYIFGTICLLILLPACFNYTNISIARALKRSKEIGLRKTMGGDSTQIFFQFITETVVVMMLSLVGSILLFFLVRHEFQAMLVFGSTLDLSLTWWTTGFFILFAILTGFFAGAAPAYYFSRLNPVQALKSQSSTKVLSGMWLRKSLTIFQFILSFGFILSLIVFARQYKYSMNYDFGFQRENILDVDLQGVDPNLFLSEFAKLSSVHAISFSSDVLGLHHSSGSSWMQFESRADSLEIRDMAVDNHFIENLGLKLLAGTNFPQGVWNHEQYLIVNEQFLKMFDIDGPVDALGKVVRVNKQDLEIIGVLKDFHFSSLREPIKSFGFRMDPARYQYANLKVSFTDAYSGISEMETLWKKMGNTSTFHANFMTDEINTAYQNYRVLLKIIAFLGMLAISISLLGMLGMVVYTSETRTKEVGIRKVLGASVAAITFLLSKDYLKLMGWAFMIAIPLSVVIIDKMLTSMQYYTVQLSVWDILAGMLILIALGLGTLSTQTIKTAYTNPADTLKNE